MQNSIGPLASCICILICVHYYARLSAKSSTLLSLFLYLFLTLSLSHHLSLLLHLPISPSFSPWLALKLQSVGRIPPQAYDLSAVEFFLLFFLLLLTIFVQVATPLSSNLREGLIKMQICHKSIQKVILCSSNPAISMCILHMDVFKRCRNICSIRISLSLQTYTSFIPYKLQ